MGHVMVDEGGGVRDFISESTLGRGLLPDPVSKKTRLHSPNGVFIGQRETHLLSAYCTQNCIFNAPVSMNGSETLSSGNVWLPSSARRCRCAFPIGSSSAHPGEPLLNCKLEDSFEGGCVASVSICD